MKPLTKPFADSTRSSIGSQWSKPGTDEVKTNLPVISGHAYEYDFIPIHKIILLIKNRLLYLPFLSSKGYFCTSKQHGPAAENRLILRTKLHSRHLSRGFYFALA